MLRPGELGRIVDCSTVVRLWRPQSYYDEPGRGTRARDGGGVLVTQGIHTLDLMLSLAGPIAEVIGYATTTPRAPHGDRGPGRRGGALRQRRVGTIDATTAAYPGFPERIEIIGEKGDRRAGRHGSWCRITTAASPMKTRVRRGRHRRRPDGVPERLAPRR